MLRVISQSLLIIITVMLVHYFSDCPLLSSSIPNGVSNGTGSVEGSHHYFTCDEGFSLVGTNTLFCNDEGKWNGSVPTCVIGKPTSLLILVLICKKGLVQYLFRPFKGMQHSLGFWIPRHRFRIPGTEFPDSLLVEHQSRTQSLQLFGQRDQKLEDSGYQIGGTWVPDSTYSRDSGVQIPLHGAIY